MILNIAETLQRRRQQALMADRIPVGRGPYLRVARR
jgi:hypothetical protein